MLSSWYGYVVTVLGCLLLLTGCASAADKLAVPDERQAVQVAERVYAEYVRLGAEFLGPSGGDRNALGEVVSADILSSIAEAREISVGRGIFAAGAIRIVGTKTESVQLVGEHWYIDLIVCLDYSDVDQIAQDGTVIAKPVRLKGVQNDVTVRVSKSSGDAKLIDESDSGVQCHD